MKTRRLLACISAAALLLTGASVWEGSAQTASGGEMPAAGFFAATNSFPVNSVVDITNLENEKTVRVIVVSGLESSGLLAILSPEAARTIELPDHSTGRIRMVQPADSVAFARFREGMALDGYYAPQYAVPDAPWPVLSETDSLSAVSLPPSGNDDGIRPEAVPVVSAGTELWPAAQMTIDEPQPFISVNFGEAPPEEPLTEAVPGEYNLVPSQERIPEAALQHTISPDDIIPPIEPVSGLAESSGSGESAGEMTYNDEEYSFVPEIVEEPSAALVYTPPSDFSPFGVPLINALERGRFYVQVGAYNRPETVEDEIARIDARYPLAIQNTGTDEAPLFRVLLGPFNQGESGAILQRVRSVGYRDAFVRRN
ncbi:MAG: SPOR domain-containing protein [Treponema sp.]|jgi:hypothetical protein|nr:SPOR domain-containing protein [Treponema sp.]